MGSCRCVHVQRLRHDEESRFEIKNSALDYSIPLRYVGGYIAVKISSRVEICSSY